MSGKTIVGETTETEMPPWFLQTVAETGIDPRNLFDSPPVNRGGKCACPWAGHGAYNFTGLGGEGGGISRTSHP